MWQKSARELQEALSAPFQNADIEWRVSATNHEKTNGLAVPYVTNRAIQTRLDDTVGIDGWHNDFVPWKGDKAQQRSLNIFRRFLRSRIEKNQGSMTELSGNAGSPEKTPVFHAGFRSAKPFSKRNRSDRCPMCWGVFLFLELSGNSFCTRNLLYSAVYYLRDSM